MCGIVGVFGKNGVRNDAAKEVFLGLTTLQHRGQDAAGILSYDAQGFHQVKNLGLAEAVFNRENMETLTGVAAIGHARYSTTGRGELTEVQPFLQSYPYGIGIVHNGNIVNYTSVAEKLKTQGRWKLMTRSDSEVILALLAQALGLQHEVLNFEVLKSAVASVFKELQGAYSVIGLIADHGLFAFRDPMGIRPLVIGRKKNAGGDDWMFASETVALYFNQYELVRDVKPGELVFVDKEGKLHSAMIETKSPRPCMFEWVYFSSPESELDQIPVYGARTSLGKKLAGLVKTRLNELRMEVDVVAAVPDTARTSASALAEELNVPCREVLIKNRYIKRTFILSSQNSREKAVHLKLSPVRSEIKGKRILLVDDSIVRGTTSKLLIDLVRKAGARQVVFVSTCPPIQNPCYYGIDFPSGRELIAYQRNLAEIEKELGADAVIYMTQDLLQKSLQDNSSVGFTPCMACLDGKYPTDIQEGKRFAERRSRDRAISESQAPGPVW